MKVALLEYDWSTMSTIAANKIVLSLVGGMTMGVDRVGRLHPHPRSDGNYVIKATSGGAECILIVDSNEYQRLLAEQRRELAALNHVADAHK